MESTPDFELPSFLQEGQSDGMSTFRKFYSRISKDAFTNFFNQLLSINSSHIYNGKMHWLRYKVYFVQLNSIVLCSCSLAGEQQICTCSTVASELNKGKRKYDAAIYNNVTAVMLITANRAFLSEIMLKAR